MKVFFEYILFTMALLASLTARSQRFPVQSTVQLSPPYSLYLADYAAPGSQRLGLNVLLRDLARPELQTRLRLTIESQGLRLTTRADYSPQPLFLQGGVPSILTADDLAPYFNPDHLDFRGITKQQVQKGGALPEGLYRICFEVLEYNSGIEVSNLGCATAWLVLNDPPLVNLPAQNDKLRAQEPQNILFQWTPRHTGSPNAAFATEYGFQLVELWPGNRDPNNAIQSMPPIFETTTFSTSLVYGPAETPLVPGRKYAFRVRARAVTGAEQLDLFRNSGYSEVRTFTYEDNCTPPTGLEAKAISSTRVRLNWTSLPQHTGFTVRYRKADSDNKWKERNTLLTEFTVEGLEPQTEYSFQILPLCGTVNGETTETLTAGTPARPTTDYTCGAEPEAFDLEGQEPLPELNYGDYIKAGDFDVMVTDVRGGNGTYSGKGLAVIPWMNSIKVRVEFNGIFVNSSYRLIRGGIKTVFNPNSKMMIDLDELKDDELEEEADTTGVGDGFGGEVVTVDGEVDTVYVNNDGDIVIVGSDGTQVVTPTDEKDGNGGDKGVMVVDASGDSWAVKDGKVIEGEPTVADNVAGSVTAAVEYPFTRFLIVGYNSQIPQPEWFYCTKANFTSAQKAKFEEKFVSTHKGYSEAIYGQKTLNNDCEVKYDPDITIRAKYIYQGSAESRILFGKYLDEYDVRWMLNQQLIPDPNAIKPQLNIGANVLELQVAEKGKGAFDTKASLTIQYATKDLNLFRVKVYRDGTEKDYKNQEMIGDGDQGEIDLSIGDKIQLELYQIDKSNNQILVQNPTWKVAGKNETITRLEVESKEFLNQLKVNKPDLLATDFLINLNVKRAEEARDTLENKFTTLDVSAIPKKQRAKRKKRYQKAIEEIRNENPTMYSLFNTKKKVGIEVHIVPKTHTRIPKTGTGQVLNGFAEATPARTEYYKQLDILYTPMDLDGGIIKNTAKLIHRISKEQIRQVKIAADKKQMTPLVTVIYDRVIERDSALAEKLKTKVLDGQFDEPFTKTIYYEVKVSEVSTYIGYGLRKMEIYLNNDAVGSDSGALTRTLAHELKHLEYPIMNAYSALKWDVINDKSQNETKYDLGDDLGKNGHCSAGNGHEMYNPENKAVCDEAKKY